jgi:phosphoribosyl-ATP pyrophosphohydrolase
MSDSISRLYDKLIEARDQDPSRSRTAKLWREGLPKIAKKMAEEGIEVAIEAVCKNREATIRESADLIYNLLMVWAATDIRPDDVWTEMERRERMLGIAEKLPKVPASRPPAHARPSTRTALAGGKAAAR